MRPAGALDAAGVLGLPHMEGRASEVLRAVLEGQCLVAEKGDEIAGLCVNGKLFAFAFLELLLVAPDHRRRGVGTLLFRAWEESASTKKLFTSTNESNIAMQRLCEGLGYVRSGLIENLDEGDPEVYYCKVR